MVALCEMQESERPAEMALARRCRASRHAAGREPGAGRATVDPRIPFGRRDLVEAPRAEAGDDLLDDPDGGWAQRALARQRKIGVGGYRNGMTAPDFAA